MSKKYIIGLDSGTQSTKVVIFDTEGNVASEGKEVLRPMYLPAPGIVEHPDDDIWESIKVASKRAMDNFKGDTKDIIGMGLGSIRFCRVLMKKDGTLANQVLSWMDERVAKPHETDKFKDVAYLSALTGYVTHRFTGEFNDTAGNYQGMWPMDTDTWQWSEDPEAYKACNLTREMLFNLKDPGSVLGHITKEAALATGFPEGIPVVASSNDKAVEALGAGLIDDKTALVSLGTYIAAMINGKENPKNTNAFWTNFSSIPNKYLYESYGIRRGTWTISWFKDILGDDLINKAKEMGVSAEDYMNAEAAKVPAGSDGLMTILEWLAPVDKPFKKGVMIGFDARHTRAHMYRSILEAIALTMKTHVDGMCDELGIKLENIVISGGGSNSELFMQIFSDMFGIPAARNVINGSASLGAAINTAVSLGVYSDYETAIDKMVKIRDVFKPNKENTELYDRMLKEVYTEITNHTDEILKKSYPIFS